MTRSDALPFFLVRPSFFPHGEVGWRPPELLPSPPPSGWSTGFIATPRTDGRLRIHRLRPALPSETSSGSAVPPSHRPAAGSQDVALLAVGVVQQRDARAPIRVVLDVRHPGRDPVLVPAEVDH